MSGAHHWWCRMSPIVSEIHVNDANKGTQIFQQIFEQILSQIYYEIEWSSKNYALLRMMWYFSSKCI